MSVYTPSYAGDPTGGVANQSYGVAAGATGVMPTRRIAWKSSK